MASNGGSRVRHIFGPNLKDLESQLEALRFKTEIIQIQKIGANWYIHFYIPELIHEKKEAKKEVSKKTKTVRRK